MENTNNINEMVLDTLIETNTNWTVEKKQLISIDGLETDKFGVFRNDNNKCLGVVGRNYSIQQNYQLIEELYKATERIGLKVGNGGSLNDGKYVFYQISLPDQYVGKSDLKRNLTALNSHDGSKSLAFGFTNTVVICQNTFYRAYNGLSKVRHTKNYQDKIDGIIYQIQDSLMMEETLMGVYRLMEEMECNNSHIDKVKKSLFGNLKEDSNILKSKLENFDKAMEIEFNDQGKTLWGLFNTVTRYSNHIDSLNTKTDFETYIMNGPGAKINNVGFNTIESIVSSKF